MRIGKENMRDEKVQESIARLRDSLDGWPVGIEDLAALETILAHIDRLERVAAASEAMAEQWGCLE